MMKIILSAALLLLPAFVFAGSVDEVVPYPNKVEKLDGCVSIIGCKVKATCVPKDVVTIYMDFALKVGEVAGVKSAAKPVTISLSMNSGLPAEGYDLSITTDGIQVSASDYSGFFYALQTIKQMLPAAIYGTEAAPGENWTIDCCNIQDAPLFAYRGTLLDCARHMFSVNEIKHFLDGMALCKMNRLHWHLSDDQGWRVEITKYPLLTKVGAYRKGTCIGFDRTTCDNVRYGGYYTKEQLREIVAYAKKNAIEIIPEIDLPGHMLAALAAYPEYGCTGGPYEVWTRWGISKDVLCPAKEKTMKFLEDIVAEVCEVFPYPYFHIGGDECPKDSWKVCPECQAFIAQNGWKDDANGTKEDYLQSYVMTRMQKFLETKGKKVIGWDEILKGNPSEGTTIMHWRGYKDCTEAARRGFDVILCPSNYFYLDFAQVADQTQCPPSILQGRMERLIPFSKTYSFDPFKGLDAEQAKKVVGVQNNLWTEYIALPEHLEYMVMPRMFATSEVQWCKPENKNYERCSKAVLNHEFKVLDAMNFVHCPTIE